MTDAGAPRVHALGDIIEIYCSRCRLNLDANVAALKDGAAVKAQCRTCWNIVPFKLPADPEAKRQKNLQRLLRLQEKKNSHQTTTGGKVQPVAADPTSHLARWQSLTTSFDIRTARPYDKHRTWAPGAFMLHKKYGVGVVESGDAEQDTVQVLFRDGVFVLEQNTPRED